jgi:hypothetical protein
MSQDSNFDMNAVMLLQVQQHQQSTAPHNSLLNALSGQQQPGLNDQRYGCFEAILKGWHQNESEIKTTTLISFLFLLAHVRLGYRTSFLPSTTIVY